jgi:hypothetical protein
MSCRILPARAEISLAKIDDGRREEFLEHAVRSRDSVSREAETVTALSTWTSRLY